MPRSGPPDSPPLVVRSARSLQFGCARRSETGHRHLRSVCPSAGLLPADFPGKAPRVQKRAVLGTSRPWLWRPSRTALDRRAGARCPRRQQNGPRVHRGRHGRLGRFPDGGASPRRVRQPRHFAAPRRWSSTEGRVHRHCCAMRPAREQADTGRDPGVPTPSRD